jgi:hypothetical protein
MPCNYMIEVERQVVRATLSGPVTGRELRDLRERIAADPGFRPDHSLLIDLTNAVATALTSADVQDLARTSKFARGARGAFVAPDPATFGLTRMFQTYREISGGQEVTAIFRNTVDAERWLAEHP